jgi:phage terminase small subunit|tara:strand:+ start:46 stop:420 length:375 start_codon:yes stop_codon:yes gene_type:complete
MELVKAKLTEKQTKLVDTLVAIGCSIKQASQEAGYAKGESGRVSAMKALKQPHVQQYMMQQISSSIGVSATIASNRVLRLATDAKSEYVQLEASKDILDRAGFKSPERHMHLHAGEVKVSIDLG